MIAIAGGRYSPFLYVLPIVALSIIVKTFLAVCRDADFVGTSAGLIFVVTIPLVLLIHFALRLGNRTLDDMSARNFARFGLLLTSALYFWLNFAFLGFQWQWWSDWKGMLAQKTSGGIYSRDATDSLTAGQRRTRCHDSARLQRAAFPERSVPDTRDS